MNEDPKLPLLLPHRRLSTHFGFADRDNFVRDLVTELDPTAPCLPAQAGSGEPTPLSRAAEGDPVVTLDEINAHLRMEPSITAEDAYLTQLEKAARLHTVAVLRRISIDATVGENVKEAMLLLIAHWYRNRESVGPDSLAELPLAFRALLSTERDYFDVY
jgi:Phage gp6-like head-tail connector protein